MIDLNATQAAIRAGYSQKTAAAVGHENLTKPEIKAAIDAARVERSQETKIDAAWVLTRLAAEAVADIADIYDDDGQLLPVKEWPLIWRQGLVQGVDVEELFDGYGKERTQIGVVRKVKLSDRVRRIELIGKHVGVKAFEEQISMTGLDALADRLARASKRDA
ncbi:terminase small subunit [Mesorhizobium muleiense]|uniref:terminase small subunit n=1 Tax=Mesorhizobium muleiense TaxID=1004279 RepID=UPI001FCD39CE